MPRSSFRAPAPAASRQQGPLAAVRASAWARYAEHPLPTDAEEIWRYSRINEFDPGEWSAASRPPAATPLPDLLDATVVTVDGYVTRTGSSGLARIGVGTSDIDRLTTAAQPRDPFADLNTAQVPDPFVIDVPARAVVDEPIVVVHFVSTAGTASFPRVVVRLAPEAHATVIERHLSADVRAWSDPVTELHVGDGAHLTHVTVQELGPQLWQTAYLAASVGRDAVLRAATVALGGDYARSRTDSVVVGAGGSAELAALYCGSGTQMHDFRTLQDHAAPKSFS